jgi:hypothetical protein
MKKELIIIGSLVLALTIDYGFRKIASHVDVMSIRVNVLGLNESYKFTTDIIGMANRNTENQSYETSIKCGADTGDGFDIINLRMECHDYSLRCRLDKTKDSLSEVPFNCHYVLLRKLPQKFIE